jgi:heme exporter protein C
MIWRILIGVWITAVVVAGFALPVAYIPGLGEKARIIYFHVPMAWVTVLAFLISMVYGLRYLLKRDLQDDVRSVSSAGLGFMFCVLATITGSIWAKFNWGSFWNWDPRETSIFVLLLIYGAYFALRSAVEVEEKRASLSAVYSIIAFLTVPFFIFILPRMVSGLHPGSADDAQSPRGGPVVKLQMDGTMLLIFFASLVGFTVLYLWMLNLRIRAAKLEIESAHDIRE